MKFWFRPKFKKKNNPDILDMPVWLTFIITSKIDKKRRRKAASQQRNMYKIQSKGPKTYVKLVRSETNSLSDLKSKLNDYVFVMHGAALHFIWSGLKFLVKPNLNKKLLKCWNFAITFNYDQYLCLFFILIE